MKRHLIILAILMFGFVYTQAQDQRAEYYDNGKLKWKGHILNGKKMGEWKFYFDNGKTMREGIYKDGKPYGEWKEYYRSGQVKSEGKYIIFGGTSQKHGPWTYYHKNGAKMKEGAYKNGKPMGTWREYNTLGIETNKKTM